jgi:D-alanine-D-alanine ligase
VELKELKGKKIGVLMGGRSSEREISLRSGRAVLESLIRGGYRATGIDAEQDLVKKLKRNAVEVAFIALHGKWGEDGTAQGLLEMLAIPYTGSGVTGSSVAMDKVMMKLLCTAANIPTPAYAIANPGEKVGFPLPYVVKPAHEGSSIGISLVTRKGDERAALKQAFQYDRKVLVEKYIKGREITVGVVNGKVLPTIEVRPVAGFYDYDAKYQYTKGVTQYIIPAEIGADTERRACELAGEVSETFELSGSVRIDMLVEGTVPLVIDINTSPGMTETSLVPKAWIYMGGTFDTLVEEILKGAALKV